MQQSKNTAYFTEAPGSTSDTTQRKSSSSSWDQSWFPKIAVTLLFLLPIFFGGVHDRVFYTSLALLSLMGAYLFLIKPEQLDNVFSRQNLLSRNVFFALCALLALALVQRIIFSAVSSPHPVTLSAAHNFLGSQFWAPFSGLLFFVLSYFFILLTSNISNEFRELFIKTLAITGFVVSLIALSHWFYDNGRLFWYFEPDFIFVTSRARWPFVNSNHLAYFLLPCFFALLSIIANKHRAHERRVTRSKKTALSNFIASKREQVSFFTLLASYIALISVVLAIIGSSSRSSWLGLSIGLCIYAVGSRKIRPVDPAKIAAMKTPEMQREERRKRERKSSRRRRSSSRSMERIASTLARLSSSARPFLIIGALLLFYIFLKGRGAEQLEERIEYGLLHSKDDIRWTLIRDSIPMLYANPIMGIGLGNWSETFPGYMNELLSGIKPGYLHSDPLQFLIELGLMILLPIAAIIYFVSRALITRFGAFSGHEGIYALGLFSGLAAILMSSFFDFPFRMPAISFLIAALLALICSMLENTGETSD